MIDKYSEIEKILLKQGKFYISLELDRIKKILEFFDNPQDKIKIIHVAGTNGKGSTCAILNEIFIEQGFKTGCYTSPHLVKYNERIKINNKNISDEDFYRIIHDIDKVAKKENIHLTEFEILTATMFIYFYENKVDIAIIEVGLGGRFDATNCIKKPVLSVITSISKDHTERLGNTIEKIALEKSGIIKENIPVIFNKHNLGGKILFDVAREKHSKIYCVDDSEIIYENKKNYVLYKNKKYEFNLLGLYQKDNVSLALKAIEIIKSKMQIDEKSILEGLKNAVWKGRFEYIKELNLLLDGCHNPDGAKKLKESLDFYFSNQKRIFIYTSLKNKDYIKIQENLFTNHDVIYCYDDGSDKFIAEQNVKNAKKTIDISEVEKIIFDKNRKDLLIICGSLYALGDILGKIEICF